MTGVYEYMCDRCVCVCVMGVCVRGVSVCVCERCVCVRGVCLCVCVCVYEVCVCEYPVVADVGKLTD